MPCIVSLNPHNNTLYSYCSDGEETLELHVKGRVGDCRAKTMEKTKHYRKREPYVQGTVIENPGVEHDDEQLDMAGVSGARRRRRKS